MAGTITKLQIQKKNKDRVNVYLDDNYAFALTLSTALELNKGRFLGDDEIAELKNNDERDKAFNRAVFFLGFRVRSQAEVKMYLRDKEYSEDVIADTIERLEEYNYLNDQGFAQAWVSDRKRFKPKGRRALQYELQQKGLNSEDIETALADIDEEALAQQALESKIRQWQHLSEADFRKKSMGFLSRRGFAYGLVKETIDEAWAQIEAQLDTDER